MIKRRTPPTMSSEAATAVPQNQMNNAPESRNFLILSGINSL